MEKGELLHTCDLIYEWMDVNDDHALIIFMIFFTILFCFIYVKIDFN